MSPRIPQKKSHRNLVIEDHPNRVKEMRSSSSVVAAAVVFKERTKQVKGYYPSSWWEEADIFPPLTLQSSNPSTSVTML